MRDLRHAVPGERTWRDPAICRDLQIEGKTFVAAWCVDGARMLVARSGTACRAPTAGEKRERRTRARWSQAFAIEVRSYAGTVVIFTSRLSADACATKGAFALGRRLGPGLEVQVVFQGRTCTFALAVENFGLRARQMRHLPGTVENGTGRLQFETNVLFRWPSLVCTSISTGSTARSAF
jgi:hypothetical protein